MGFSTVAPRAFEGEGHETWVMRKIPMTHDSELQASDTRAQPD